MLVDVAHNPHGAAVLVEAVTDSFNFSRLVGVVGVLDDKDAEGILEALEPLLAEVVVTRSSSPRAIDPDELGDSRSTSSGQTGSSSSPPCRTPSTSPSPRPRSRATSAVWVSW